MISDRARTVPPGRTSSPALAVGTVTALPKSVCQLVRSSMRLRRRTRSTSRRPVAADRRLRTPAASPSSRLEPSRRSYHGDTFPGPGLAALQAVQTEEDKQRGTIEVMDFASSLGLTMIHDHGGLSGLAPYQYALNLWRQGKLKVRQRPFFWSGDDPGFSVEEARIVNNFNRLGDDFWRTNGVGERLNTSTTNPGFVDASEFAASNGWTLTQHSSTLAEIQFHISAYEAAAEFGPIDEFRWSLCHVNNITDELIQAIVGLGIGVNIQGTSYTSALSSTPSGPALPQVARCRHPCGRRLGRHQCRRAQSLADDVFVDHRKKQCR